MKTKFLRLSCLILILFSFFGCCKECKECEKCEDKLHNPYDFLGDNFVDDEIEIYLKFDCSDKVSHQPIHLDLKHGFGIISKIDATTTNINTMSFYLKEIDGKSRWDLSNARYEKETKDSTGIKTHHFRITLNKGTNDELPKNVDLSALKGMMTKGDRIDIHIDSDDSNIRSKPHAEKTNFGQQFCKSVVTHP